MQHVEGLWDRRLEAGPRETPFAARGGPRPERPNVVFILADDLGWGDLGCYGSLHIRTPNLDRLAAGGVRFTHAYSSSPWCSPARIALYTGRNPGRFPAGLEEPLATRAEGKGIPHGHPTLPSLLASAGYDTAMFGKWHCGWLPWYSPLKIGFQRFFGNFDGAMDYFTHIGTLGEPDLYEGEVPVEMEGYYTDLITDRAVDYVNEIAGAPFYLQVNYNAPHWPWEGRGDRDVAERIKRQSDEGGFLPLLHTDGGSLAKYAELVEIMDEGIGRLLVAIDAQGIADNTIVIFCSDNGGERYSFMWPFLGAKGDCWEGGIRIPFIIRWPVAIGSGQWSAGYHCTVDWTASLLDAAGVDADPEYPLDGVSLLPWLLDGENHPEHTLFWRISSQGALRRGRYKYVVDGRLRPFHMNWPLFPGMKHDLYDLAGDGREAANLARVHPAILDELREAWRAIDSELLDYPEDHRGGAPMRATRTAPAISQPD